MSNSTKELSNREVSNKNLKAGRPKGAKNKTTLFKEAMRNGFESLLETEGEKVFRAVVDKALGEIVRGKDGKPLLDEEGNPVRQGADMTAAKLIMDRVMPVADVTGAKASGNMQVVINVDSMTTEPTITVMDADKDVVSDQ